MPRPISGRSSARRAPPRAAPVRNPPQPVHSAPPPAPVQGGGSMLGGIVSNIADGMAWGTGISIAHAIAQRAVDAVMGPVTVRYETVGSKSPAAATAPMSNSVGADSCSNSSKAFLDCINYYGGDISKCQFYLDMLNECRRGGSATAI